jgi:uncharacterized protein (TIGR03437 family)
MTCRIHVLIGLLAAWLPARAATLSSPSLAAAPGDLAIAGFAFSDEGQPISGIQFDVEWDNALDVKLVIGDQLRASSKLLYTVAPDERTIRCLIVGPNSDALANGELLKAFIMVAPDSALGTAQVRMKSTFATDPAGNAIPLAPMTLDVQIQDGPTVSAASSPARILNAASLLPGGISPGEVIALVGRIPASDVSVFLNGVPAPILYAGQNQINAIVPFGLDLNRPATVDLRFRNQSLKIPVAISPSSPALFTQNGTGTGPGAILNADYSVNSASNPAPRASTVMLFGTGFGTLEPLPSDGAIVTATAPTTAPVSATIAGAPAVITYAGAAPGLVAGVVQINVQIPPEIPPNPAARILLRIGSATIPAGVTLAIR